MLAPRKYLYQKEATGMERPEMYSVSRCINPTYLCGPSSDGPISMVPCLHQGNIYIKRKLRVWRDQKCIPLVGAITLLNCAGRHNTPPRGRQYRSRTESLVNWYGPMVMVPCLHQAYIYTKRKLRVWKKCISLVGAIIPLTCAVRQNTQSRG